MDYFISKMPHPLLERIIQLLPTNQPAYLVGGAVRDALLERKSVDLDFATAADALRIGRALADGLDGAFFPLDPERNVARIVLKPGPLNSETVKIDIAMFQGASLEADLSGRDFTINAMALDVRHLDKLIDPMKGAEDLRAKRLRVCSPGSFLNDPVRILRAVRFSVDLTLKLPAETLRLMRAAIPGLPQVSAERLRDELFRILLQAHPSSSLRILDKVGALEYVIPEICVLKNVKQGPPHVLDVWDHTLDILVRMESLLEVLAPAYDPDKALNLSLGQVVLRLGRFRQPLAEHLDSALNPDRPHRGLLFMAGLYHDVGKLATRSMNGEGLIRFIGHDQAGIPLVEKRALALRLSNLEINRLTTIVGNHMRPSLLSHSAEAPSRKAVYHFFKDTGAAGVDICILSMADILATYGATLPQERWTRHLEVVRSLLGAWWEDKAEKVLPPALLNGDELKEQLKLSPGPVIGYLLESIREAQVSGEVTNPAEAIEFARKILAQDLYN